MEGDLDLDMGDESSEGGPSTGPRQRQDMNEIGRKAAFLAFGNNADNCPDRKLGKPWYKYGIQKEWIRVNKKIDNFQVWK